MSTLLRSVAIEFIGGEEAERKNASAFYHTNRLCIGDNDFIVYGSF